MENKYIYKSRNSAKLSLHNPTDKHIKIQMCIILQLHGYVDKYSITFIIMDTANN